MKRLSRLLLLTACLFAVSCAEVSIPLGNAGGDAIGSPYTSGYQASAPQAAKFKLFAGADMDQAQVVYPNGPSIAIAGLKTSPGMQMVTNTIDGGLRWMGLGGIAKGYFKDKSNSATQAGLTSRAKIGAEAGVRTAEINAFKPIEPLPVIAPAAAVAAP